MELPANMLTPTVCSNIQIQERCCKCLSISICSLSLNESKKNFTEFPTSRSLFVMKVR